MTTLDEVKASKKELLSIADIAPVLGITPTLIRNTLNADPKAMGFAVCRYGKRQIRIPRRAFIKFMEEGK